MNGPILFYYKAIVGGLEKYEAVCRKHYHK